MGQICHRRSTTPPDSLVERLLQYTSPATSKSIDHGHQYETAARTAYVQVNSNVANFCVEERGLIIAKDMPWFGASVDGVVYDPREAECGVLEIKCPFVDPKKAQVETVEQLVNLRGNSFYLHSSPNGLVINHKHNYYFQVQAQMGILNLD